MNATRVDDGPPPGGMPRERLAREAESLGALVSGLLQDLQDLVRAEIALAKAELKDDATTAGKAAGTLAAGGVVGLVAFIFLMLAVTFVLAIWLPLWVSALIVAVVLGIVAAILVMRGKQSLSQANLAPEQTIATLKEDQAWAKRQINSVRR
ncbi:MAG TPA: phage holin family protein [Thermomicrobiales bacterium]|nr:phage holin family protein [Thermomicrobiales bacterium]